MRETLVGESAEDALGFQTRATYALGAEAAIFARQLLFWEGRAGDKAGFIWNSQAEWIAQTGLTENAQKRARKILKAKGVLEEHANSTPPVLHYRLNLVGLMEVLEEKLLPSRKEHKRKGNVSYAEQYADEPTIDEDEAQELEVIVYPEAETDVPCEDHPEVDEATLVLCHSLVAWLEEHVYPRRLQATGEDIHVQEVRRPPHRKGARQTRNAPPARQGARPQTALRSHTSQDRRRWSRPLDRREDSGGF